MFTYALSTHGSRSALLATSGRRSSTRRQVVGTASRHAYGRFLEDLVGVNGSVARACMLLQTPRDLASDSYLDTCVDQVAFLYGRNLRSLLVTRRASIRRASSSSPVSADSVDGLPRATRGGGWPDRTSWQDMQGTTSKRR